MARLHPDDIQAIAERVILLLSSPPKKEQRFESDFGKRILTAKAQMAEIKARRAA